MKKNENNFNNNYKAINDRELGATELAINIRAIIKNLSINQGSLAKMTGLRQGQISEIIRGFRPNLSWFVLYQIAKALGTSMESLIEGTYDIENIRAHIQRAEPRSLTPTANDIKLAGRRLSN